MAALEDKQNIGEAYLRAQFANSVQITLSTTATLLSTLLTNASGTVKMHRQTVVLTNNDAAIDVYVGISSSLSSTRFMKKIAAGAEYAMQIGAGIDPYIKSASGTPVMEVTQLT